ncbi:MAG: GAP family protein [Solirubrobacterales bacterium]
MDIFLLALSAALNPTLLAATTVMLLLPQPRNLMLGYLLGAMMTSVSLGLVIVFSLEDSGAVEAARDTLGPAADIALGAIFIIVALALNAERDAIFRERRERRKSAKGKAKREKGPPRWRQVLSRGTPRTTFAVGALLTLPGASYLVALTRLAKDNLGAPETVLVILGFNLIMLVLLELPLLSYWLEPDATPGRVERFNASLRRDGRRIAIRIAAGAGALLVVRGVITLIA